MRPDIQAYVLTAGGLQLQQADWTSASRSHVRRAMEMDATRRGIDAIFVEPTSTPSAAESTYAGLHAAVGATIAGLRESTLPSKAGHFDWSLGPGVTELAEQYNADYALFLTYRSLRSTLGRRLLATALLAGGVVMPSAVPEAGFISLVDLRTGDLVWFNKFDGRFADAGDDADAARLIRSVMQNFPNVR